MVKKLLKSWRSWRYPYTPLVEITISKDRLLHNLHTFQKNSNKLEIAPVLKSNAYGHGLGLVAKIVDREEIPFIVVDSYHEALILRNEGITSPILIIGYTPLENIETNKLKSVAFTIISLDQLEEISDNLSHVTDFHIKIDTGMHRQGITTADFEKAIALLDANKAIHLTGMCSHLGDQDGTDPAFTKSQIKIWNEIVPLWKKEFPSLKYFHLGATGGFSYSEKVAANMLRLGIGLYGLDPTDNKRLPDLKPVLEMKSVISGTKKIKRGEKVGYSKTFEAPTDMHIATVPAGYYEGIDRRLSNKGFFKVGNTFCPIIGRVSMNITTIDITDVPNSKLNTPVILISKECTDKNSIENIVGVTGAIERDLMVHIPQQLRRIVV